MHDDPTLKRRITDIGVIVELARAGARERVGFATLSRNKKPNLVDLRTVPARVIWPTPQVMWARV